MEFSSRMTQILFLLINATQPIHIGKLAEHLTISRRTVFRELENIDRSLKKYNLQLTTKQPQGLWLDGTESTKQEFKKVLENSTSFDSKNKDERQKNLILELLTHDEPEKLYYYAKHLDVSESTVSNDLLAIEPELVKKNIALLRRPGYGVYLTYDETDYRKALLHYIAKYSLHDFFISLDSDGVYARSLDKELLRKIISIVEFTQNKIFLKMTEESYIACIVYLSITVIRAAKYKQITTEQSDNTNFNEQNLLLANHLASEIESEFDIVLPIAERIQIAIYLNGAKLQNLSENSSCLCREDDQLLSVVYEMINSYDALTAFDFKHDNDFVTGIIAHLKPTIVRLKHHIEITNPFLPQIKATYPEIYYKTQKAAIALAKYLECEIPEDELGFLALHFGAGVVRHKRKHRQRKVSVGVVCTSGIGISRLLLSRLTHIFQNQITVTVFAQMDLSTDLLESIDFVVSTHQIDCHTKPFTVVNPMLNEKDIAEISKNITYYATQKQQHPNREATSVDANDSMLITAEMHSIINNFQICYLDPGIDYDETIEFAATKLGQTALQSAQITADLRVREQQSTQVIPEYEIALLHAKTTAVGESKLMLLLPSSTYFTKPHFIQAKAAIVMLIPRHDNRRTLAISSISTALFEDDAFLAAIKAGNEHQIRRDIQYYLEQFLLQYLKSIYEN